MYLLFNFIKKQGSGFGWAEINSTPAHKALAVTSKRRRHNNIETDYNIWTYIFIANRLRIYNAVAGEIIVETSDIEFAGKPP